MSRWFPALLLALAWAVPANAAGLLIPTDKNTSALTMLNHRVSVTIDEQVAVTKVEQTFRNHTSQILEATYIFPVPKGASVNRFSMWVDGKEVKGELVEADKAREVYTDIVRRIQDPGLLEYMGSNLLRLRVFPIPANGEQKVAVRFTAINALDSGLVCYSYPLKTEGKSSITEKDFSLDVTLQSKQTIQNVYSPTHSVAVTKKNDGTAHVRFEKKEAALDRDFQLYYSLGKGDVGLTGLTHRPEAGKPGHFLFLISPRAELKAAQEVPRDFVFVMDTSGSMAGKKMEQARKALLFCLDQLGPKDRFAVLNFATVVNQFSDGLSDVEKDALERAKKWVRELSPVGGTAIDLALQSALALRTSDTSRPFTVVFFTDGEPTVGETNPDRIVKNVTDRNTSHTRIFTFGVGDELHATLLDRLADSTRAVSTFVRPEEDIEAKVSALYAKISHPVMTDLKLTVGEGVRLSEMYPSSLPDLFHGGQLVVLGQYTGKGAAVVELTGKVGSEEKKLTYELSFPAKTGDDRAFVEHLWARRKVGYLLDEIRRNGEKAELKDEVVKLAKKHGIATPYTSYLVVPDAVPTTNAPIASTAAPMPPPTNRGGVDDEQVRLGAVAPRADWSRAAGADAALPAPGTPVQGTGSAMQPQYTAPTPTAAPLSRLQTFQAGVQSPITSPAPMSANAPTIGDMGRQGYRASAVPKPTAPQFRAALERGEANTGKLGVDLAVTLDEMRNNAQVGQTNTRRTSGRTCCEVNGVWVDESFDAKMASVRVKALSAAYFRLLEKQPTLGEVFKLGTRVVWVTPSGKALVIDPASGQESMSDSEIDALFTAKK